MYRGKNVWGKECIGERMYRGKQGSRGRRIRRPGTKKIGFGRMVLRGAESPDASYFCCEASQPVDLLTGCRVFGSK